MRFDFDGINPGTFFPYDEARNEKGELVCKDGVSLRVAPDTALRDLRKAATPRGATEMDIVLFDKLLWDYCITGWVGTEDANGEPIECNIETKATLMGGDPVFSTFVSKRLSILRARMPSERYLEKN